MPVNAQVICEQICAGEVIVNTWALTSTTAASPLTSAVAFGWADEFEAFYTQPSGAASPDRGIDDVRPNNLTLVRIVVREILPGNVAGVFYERALANAGTAGGDTMPLQCAMIVKLRTGTPGRSGRGRVYIGPFTDTNLAETADAGQWESSLVDKVLAAVDDLDLRSLAATPAPFTLAVWSRTDAAFRLATAWAASSKVFSQRRRNVKTANSYAASGTPGP